MIEFHVNAFWETSQHSSLCIYFYTIYDSKLTYYIVQGYSTLSKRTAVYFVRGSGRCTGTPFDIGLIINRTWSQKWSKNRFCHTNWLHTISVVRDSIWLVCHIRTQSIFGNPVLNVADQTATKTSDWETATWIKTSKPASKRMEFSLVNLWASQSQAGTCIRVGPTIMSV